MKTIEKTNDVLEKVNENLFGTTYGWTVNPAMLGNTMHGTTAGMQGTTAMYGVPVAMVGTQYGQPVYLSNPATLAAQAAYLGGSAIQPSTFGTQFQQTYVGNVYAQQQPVVAGTTPFTTVLPGTLVPATGWNTPVQQTVWNQPAVMNTPVQPTVWGNNVAQTPWGTVITGTPVTHPFTPVQAGWYGNSLPVSAIPGTTPVFGTNPITGNVFQTLPTAANTVLPVAYQGTTPATAGTMFTAFENAAFTNGSALAQTTGTTRAFTNWTPAINVIENEKNFQIEVAVPGLTKDDCKIGCERGNCLWVSGTRRIETEAVVYTRNEINHGTFFRSFVLPEYLDVEKCQAKCVNGLLTITIPNKIGTNKRSESEIVIS